MTQTMTQNNENETIRGEEMDKRVRLGDTGLDARKEDVPEGLRRFLGDVRSKRGKTTAAAEHNSSKKAVKRRFSCGKCRLFRLY